MEERKLTELIRKYLAGEASDSEKGQLNGWFSAQSENEAIWETDSDKEESQVEKRMLNQIKTHIHTTKSGIAFKRSFIFKVAATFTGLLFCAGIYFYAARHNQQKNALLSASVSAPANMSENKYVTLPDSSVVVLHGGSRIKYTFNGKIRQLSLVGEAYFDIKHNAEQPFIIQTAELTTTVLGTAFNIKAVPGQNITVSVTRGKVSVQDMGKKMIAVLLPSQQVIYNDLAKTASLKEVKAPEVLKWAMSDMQLDDIPFKKVAEVLSRRYDVIFKFQNPDIEKCVIHGRFDGTESLSQVLDALTQTTNAHYVIDKQLVTIDGASCQ